jgi:hypothetical protein
MELQLRQLPQTTRGNVQRKPRTQDSLAISVDGSCWVLLNASPDNREQVADILS